MIALAEQGEQGMQTLSDKFELCIPLKNKDELPLLLEYVYNAISYMSMVDYPYPNSFLQPLPAWPVQVSCQFMTPETDDVVRALALVVGVYYNSTGDQSCASVVQPISPSLGTRAWDYQGGFLLPLSNS
jgi:lysosomal Pro-X carboxypeptidase